MTMLTTYGLGLYAQPAVHSAQLREVMELANPVNASLWRDIDAEFLLDAPEPVCCARGRSRLLNTMTSHAGSGLAAWSLGIPRNELVGSMTGDYPHLRYETVETFWNTRITQLATNTTLGTSSTHTTESQNIYVSQTNERVFKACRVECWFRTEWAATNNVAGWTITFQLGAGPTLSFTQAAATAISTASRNTAHHVNFDIPASYLQTYFTGTSAAAVITLTVSSATAANINGITFKAITTFGFAKSSATRTVTRRFPIQSLAGSLTTSHQEVGTDGTGPVAANQIQAWDTYLPEASKTIHNVWLALSGSDGVAAAGAATTPYIKLDAAVEVARATIDRTLGCAMQWYDHYDISALSTASAHSFNARADVTGQMLFVGGFIYVTYSYDAATTTSAMYEAIVPLTQGDYTDAVFDHFNAVIYASGAGSPSAADKARNVAVLDIQETNPVIKQSGVMLHVLGGNAGVNETVWCGNLTPRSVTNNSQVNDAPLVVRGDNGTGAWSLARGLNKLIFTSGIVVNTTMTGYSRPFAIINYVADVKGDPINGNHPVYYPQRQCDGLAAINCDVPENTESMIPVTLGLPYKLNAVMLDSFPTIVAYPNDKHKLVLAQHGGEFDGGYCVAEARPPAQLTVSGSQRNTMSILRFFNASNRHTGKLDITARRRQLVMNNNGAIMNTWGFWVTYHSLEFTVAGNVTIKGTAAAAGKAVQIWGYKFDGSGDAELIAETTTNALGNFSATVLDSTREYFATYSNDGVYGRSDLATPV